MSACGWGIGRVECISLKFERVEGGQARRYDIFSLKTPWIANDVIIVGLSKVFLMEG